LERAPGDRALHARPAVDVGSAGRCKCWSRSEQTPVPVAITIESAVVPGIGSRTTAAAKRAAGSQGWEGRYAPERSRPAVGPGRPGFASRDDGDFSDGPGAQSGAAAADPADPGAVAGGEPDDSGRRGGSRRTVEDHGGQDRRRPGVAGRDARLQDL